MVLKWTGNTQITNNFRQKESTKKIKLLTIFRSDNKVDSNQRKEKARFVTTAIHNAGFMGFITFSFSILYLFTFESDVH